MSDAPERIGLVGNGLGQWALATQDEAMFAVHYVRADPHDALRVRIAELEASLATVRNEALEDAARAAERDCDWTAFGKAGIEEWDGGPDGVRDYRLGIRAGRAIAAAIRALRESPDA